MVNYLDKTFADLLFCNIFYPPYLFIGFLDFLSLIRKSLKFFIRS
nr:MAG TPA: hypothetical protein [Caudoviricetes sp.]DAR76018.1 MAG TPA: hypothetical protein [Caudoviricetes sp.]